MIEKKNFSINSRTLAIGLLRSRPFPITTLHHLLMTIARRKKNILVLIQYKRVKFLIMQLNPKFIIKCFTYAQTINPGHNNLHT